VRLQTACDGTPWLVTDGSAAQFRDNEWTVELTELAGRVIGIDRDGRFWVVGEDFGEISAWDGSSWTAYGAGAGWAPIADTWYRHVGWGRCDPAGRFWLTTSQDVRVFDGGTWTVFTPEDMGIGQFPSESCVPQFQITILESSGDIWIGHCEWAGVGPCGGQGARWFDGSAWHGADSPVSNGCVAALEEDSAGNVWLGLDDVLWRFEPGSGNWAEFVPPETPPLGYRRHGAILGLTVDAFGRKWVVEFLCGGAGCDAHAVYHVRDGLWTLLSRAEDVYYVLVLRAATDAAGRAWLFGDIVYRLTETDYSPAAFLTPTSVAVDPAGRIWFIVHGFPHGLLCTVDGGAGD
jgi:hypothetical protein